MKINEISFNMRPSSNAKVQFGNDEKSGTTETKPGSGSGSGSGSSGPGGGGRNGNPVVRRRWS